MNTIRTLVTGLALCLACAPCLAQGPADFEARLELYRNDKLTGEMVFRLSSDEQHWVMTSETKGIRGLARFLGLHENSMGKGDWRDGAARPLRYKRTVKVIKTLRWSAKFDWQEGTVHTIYPDGESTLDLEPGMVDESALGMEVRAGLARGEDAWQFRLVDEDEIEDAKFRVSSVEFLQTALGCMKVHVVEKVRGETSTRYTRTYYADAHAFAPVRIEHGKTGGDTYDGRVTSLTVEGQPVAPGPDCDGSETVADGGDGAKRGAL